MSQNYIGIWAGFLEEEGQHGKSANLRLVTETIEATDQADAETKFNAFCTQHVHPKVLHGQPVTYKVIAVSELSPPPAPTVPPTSH